jgi:hypothetical protein
MLSKRNRTVPVVLMSDNLLLCSNNLTMVKKTYIFIVLDTLWDYWKNLI